MTARNRARLEATPVRTTPNEALAAERAGPLGRDEVSRVRRVAAQGLMGQARAAGRRQSPIMLNYVAGRASVRNRSAGMLVGSPDMR